MRPNYLIALSLIIFVLASCSSSDTADTRDAGDHNFTDSTDAAPDLDVSDTDRLLDVPDVGDGLLCEDGEISGEQTDIDCGESTDDTQTDITGCESCGLCDGGICYECTENDHCTNGVCNNDNECVDCLIDTDCNSPEVCLDGQNECGECSSGADCDGPQNCCSPSFSGQPHYCSTSCQ